MKYTRHFIFILILVFAGTSYSEEVAIKEPRWKQLSQAYGFVLSQQASLEVIEKKFPLLRKDVKDAWFAFNSTALGESLNGVEKELSMLLGHKWVEYKKEMTAQIDSLFETQELTQEQAIAFLKEVNLRAKGDMPESILAVLLSAHPRFSINPEQEILNGWKQTFRTKNHSKAKGTDFSISFPISWSKREGNRPNIIQVFQSGSGHGPAMCVLIAKNIPLPTGTELSKEDLENFFQPSELKEMLPAGSTFIDAEKITLEGSPAGILISDQIEKRLDLEVIMRMTQFVTIYDNTMIFIQFTVSRTPESTETLEGLQKQFLPTFKAVANTFVLNNRYE
jgi:hypothetical protein